MPRDRTSGSSRPGASRRQFLLGGAAAGLGAAAALGAQTAIGSLSPEAEPTRPGDEVVPFHGEHQAGIATAPQAHAVFLALDLHDDADRDALRRMMRVLTDDAVRLTRGEGALADTEPELAVSPSRLTVTFGFGPLLAARAGAAGPDWLRPLPPFGVDRLEDAWSHGDLLLQIAADDPVTVAHARRMLLKDSRSFARLRWVQDGFRYARGTRPGGATARNLFGQLDGTANPAPGTDEFDRVVWNGDGWLAGGTSLVVRRIRMDLDGWDRVGRTDREQAIGRTLDTGAPLTGTAEHDEPDFAALGPAGFPIIGSFAHIRRARPDDPAQRIFRRAYNYDTVPGAGISGTESAGTDSADTELAGTGISDAGLLFASYQADVDAQFVPIQRRLDDLDLLNTWTTPIGSAVFAVPPGCRDGGFIGETLLA